MNIFVESIRQHAVNNPEGVAFGVKRKGNWERVSWSSYFEKSIKMSDFLKNMGVSSGDRVAVWSVNSPSWNIADLGIAMCGAAMVSIFPNADEETVKQILFHSQPSVVFVSSPLQRDTIITAVPERAGSVFLLDLTEGISDKNTEIGRPVPWSDISGSKCPEETASIFYTSGTSGIPKAVMHSRESLIMSARWIIKLFDLTQKDTALSVLPLTFIYERLHNYACQLAGVTVYYAGLTSAYRETMKEVEPDFFVAVPQILLQIFQEISRTTEGKIQEQKALEYALNNDPSSDIMAGFLPESPAAYSEIFRNWRSEFGGKIRCFSFGAAAMPESITRFFWNIGIPALMAYGSNEMSLVANNVFPGNTCSGSVGVAVNEDVSIRIHECEIQVKTPAMMQGYYKDEKLTAAAYTEDGWYKTGDSGEWREKRFLVITGRKDDLFKASNGRFINPSEITQKFSDLTDEGHIIVFPDKQQRICLLIHDTTDGKVSEKEICERISAFNNAHPDKQISGYCLLRLQWTVETGELTPNLKLRRKFIIEKYSNELEKKLFMSFEKYTLANFCRLIEEEFEELPEGTVKPYSDFSDFLVLSSVNALILMSKIFNVYGVRVGIDDLKENSNIRELYRFVISKTTLC